MREFFSNKDLPLWLTVLVTFFIPISATASTIFAFFLILYWLLKGRLIDKWNALKHRTLFWAWMFYILLYPLSILWSNHWEWVSFLIERHLYFILVPVLLTLADKYWPKPVVWGYALGFTVSEIHSYLIWFHLLPGNAIDPVPTNFAGHFLYNPLLAFAIFVLSYEFLYSRERWMIKLLSLFFVVTMTVNMFITGGRGGQIVYFVLMSYLFYHYLIKKIGFRYAALGSVLAVSSIFFLAYHTSNLFHDRVNLALNNFYHYQVGSGSSVGMRLNYYYFTVKMGLENKQRLIYGYGLGEYPDAMHQFAKERGVELPMRSDRQHHFEPHSQYFYELGAFGLIGLISLLWLIILHYVEASKLSGVYRDYAIAFALFLTTILISDALFIYFEAIFAVAVLSGVLFSNRIMSIGSRGNRLEN